MRTTRHLFTAIVLVGLLAPDGARGQRGGFRSSLTATVVVADSTAAPVRGRPPDPLGCRTVLLRWERRVGAVRYEVFVAGADGERWMRLPRSNVCGASRPAGATSLVDIEPTSGAPTVGRRLRYRVVAIGGPGAGHPIDSTAVLPLRLP